MLAICYMTNKFDCMYVLFGKLLALSYFFTVFFLFLSLIYFPIILLIKWSFIFHSYMRCDSFTYLLISTSLHFLTIYFFSFNHITSVSKKNPYHLTFLISHSFLHSLHFIHIYKRVRMKFNYSSISIFFIRCGWKST